MILQSGAWQFQRVANRIWREMSARVPPVAWAVRQRYRRRMRAHRHLLRPLPPVQDDLLAEMRRIGVAVVGFGDVGLSGTDALKVPLERLAAQLAARSLTTSYPLCASRPEVLDEIEVWRWGLREDVLDLVESYLEVPTRYYGAEVRRELTNGHQMETRQWHLDVEDHRVFRILVWLDDVSPHGGAFEWIARDLTSRIARQLRYVSGYRSEAQMATVVSRHVRRSAVGPRWTAVFADTHSVFHRAGTPCDRDRYSVMFTWTTRWPVKTVPVGRFTIQETARLEAGLTPRQRAALAPELLAR